jgi:hypothetical protein
MAFFVGPSERDEVTVPVLPTCSRCGGRSLVIEDDGPDVCWVCVVAWGSYAGLVTAPASGETEDAPAAEVPAEEPQVGRDPTVTALLHWSHRTPVNGCPLCLARR